MIKQLKSRFAIKDLTGNRFNSFCFDLHNSSSDPTGAEKNSVSEELRGHSPIREDDNPAAVQPAPEPQPQEQNLPLTEKGAVTCYNCKTTFTH